MKIEDLKISDNVKAILVKAAVDLTDETVESLQRLDGIGPATAGDIMSQVTGAEIVTVAQADPPLTAIRNNTSRRLIVPTDITIAGQTYQLSQSYEFQPSAARSISEADAAILLRLSVTQANVCCGAVATSRPMFVKVV